MFDNIGGKIKTVAKIVTVLGIIASVLVGIVMLMGAKGEVGVALMGFLVMGVGSLASWLSSFMTYGFGQLIENTDILVSRTPNQKYYGSKSNYLELYKTTAQPKPAEKTLDKSDKVEALVKLRDNGIITQEEYEKKLEEL